MVAPASFHDCSFGFRGQVGVYKFVQTVRERLLMLTWDLRPGATEEAAQMKGN